MRAEAGSQAHEILTRALQNTEHLRVETEEALASARTEAATIVDRAQKAAESLLEEARVEAARAREDAEARTRQLLDEAAGARQKAEEDARLILLSARESAQDAHVEGAELATNLRQLGDSFRANAERLMGDVQRIHRRLGAELDRVERSISGPDAAPSRPEPRGRDFRDEGMDSGDFDVPEFIPRR